ncbi:hypothetical protein EAF04_010884 [Stromatinia cepivora]|nr:hypothetical protein EAF04_010884 [Stromatinia cepivora]
MDWESKKTHAKNLEVKPGKDRSVGGNQASSSRIGDEADVNLAKNTEIPSQTLFSTEVNLAKNTRTPSSQIEPSEGVGPAKNTEIPPRTEAATKNDQAKYISAPPRKMVWSQKNDTSGVEFVEEHGSLRSGIDNAQRIPREENNGELEPRQSRQSISEKDNEDLANQSSAEQFCYTGEDRRKARSITKTLRAIKQASKTRRKCNFSGPTLS